MQTSRTFTTPGGRKVATRARKLYMVVRDDGTEATVRLRTDSLATLERFVRYSRNSITPGSPITVHAFRKSDGAHLCGQLGIGRCALSPAFNR